METAQKIGPDSRLQDDLGVYGDDVMELLSAYSKAFGVDVSNFMAADYFDGEGFDILALFRKSKSKKVLTVLHMQWGIDAGRLDEEVINGGNGGGQFL